MVKKTDILFIIVCLVLTIIPFLMMNRQEDIASTIDNRKLAEAPEFGTENFTTDYEVYLQDRIGFRNQMVNIYALFNDKAFNELTHPTYTYGQDGYVFFKMHPNNPYGDYPKQFADMVKKLQIYCESRGTKFYFIFDPEKTSVYRNYLPKGVNYDNSWVNEMFSYMDKLEINYVDNSQLLIEKSQKEQVFNRVYDAGHWNDLGMFYGTNALWERIHEDFPAVTTMKKNEFNITEVEKTTLPISEFKISELVPQYELKQKIQTNTQRWHKKVKQHPSYQAFRYEKNMSAEAKRFPNILFFQGSYYNRGARFIASRSNTYVGIHNYQNVFELPYYYNIFKPDIVILDAAEYVFSDSYFDSSKMKKMKLNPSLSLESYSLENVTRTAQRVNSSTDADMILDSKVDRIFLEDEYKKAEYAYLLINNEVYDFIQNDNRTLELSLAHGNVKIGDKGLIIIEEKSGNKICASITIKKATPLAKQLLCTEGASIDDFHYKNEDGERIELKTKVRKNKFGSVVLQIYNEDTGDFIENIKATSENGECSGIYLHNLPTGKYKLVLKANSNIADEAVSFDVNLTNGKGYYYLFNIRSLSEKECIINYLEVFTVPEQ